MLHVSVLGWIWLSIAALFAGVSKTALPGLMTLSVVIFAAFIPAKQSTAVILILLLTGDLIAIWTYRRDADWPTLRRLLTPVVIGVALGSWFLTLVDDQVMKRVIGWIVLVLTTLTLGNMYRQRHADRTGTSSGQNKSPADTISIPARIFYGCLGGFTTMTANAGGPIMSLYFLWARFPMVKFLGTTAWFFFMVNLIKLPFSTAIGLVNLHTFFTGAILIPLVLLGAFLGRGLVKRMRQEVFEPLIVLLTIGSALYLVI